MATQITSNGSKWAGEQPDNIETLLAVLAEHPLDRVFESYGNFVTPNPVNMRGEPVGGPGSVSFFGNFHTVSHVFNIDTNDVDVTERLTAAIRENQKRPDYLAQPDDVQRKAAEEGARRANDDRRRVGRERKLCAELRSLRSSAA